MNKTSTYSLMIGSILSISLLSCGGDSTSPGHAQIDLLSATLYAGPFWSIEVEGQYAYCGAEGSFQIISLEDKQNPIFVGGASMPNIIYDVSISGNYAYLAAREDGLIICDISNVENPRIVGKWDLYGNQYGKVFEVYVSGNYVIAWFNTDGLQIIDVSNPSNPVRIGYYDNPGVDCGDFYVSGSFAYLHEGDSLSIVDISDPANPVRVAYFGREAYFIDGRGTHLFTSSSGNTPIFEIYDISDPINPEPLGTLEGPFGRLAVYENYVYTVESGYTPDGDIMIIDISDPADPNLVGTYTTPNRAVYVLPKDGYIYAVDDQDRTSGKLFIADITDPSSPVDIGDFTPASGATDIFVFDNYAYAVTGYGLHIVDVSNAYSPVDLGYFEIGGYRSIVEVVGNRMFMGGRDSTGLRIYNVSDIRHPTLLGTFGDNNETGYRNLDIEGDYAYAAAGLIGLDIVDVSNPSEPALVNHIDTVYSVFVSGNYCYAGRSGPKIGIYDIADPSNPILLGEYASGSTFGIPYDIVVSNQIAYVAVHYEGLQIVDVSDPANPALIGRYEAIWPDEMGFFASGDRAYFAMGKSGLQIIDVSNPNNAVLDAVVESGYYTLGVFVVNDVIYVGDGSSLKIYRYNY